MLTALEKYYGKTELDAVDRNTYQYKKLEASERGPFSISYLQKSCLCQLFDFYKGGIT